jgi:hypothetical protein
MRWVFAAYSLPLLVPLVLAALDPIWGALTFIILGIVLVLTSIDTGRRILMKGGSGLSKAPVINEWLTDAAVLVAVVLPWVIGSWVPQPSAFIPSLLLVLAAGFASTISLVMAEFNATMGMTKLPDQKPVEPGR